MIKSIKLNNFRKFQDHTFDIEKPLVIIHGDNAKGKSTILESLYLLTNGSSPWGSNEDIFHNGENGGYFRVEITKDEDGMEREYAIYKDDKRKQLQIDGQNTIARKFFVNKASTIFSPDLIELLMISPSKRRSFMDDLISKIDIGFAQKVSKYRKVLRQRNAYLKKLSKRFYETGAINTEDTQLKYWTDEAITLSSHIISKRSQIIGELESEHFKLKYSSSLKLNLFEDMTNEEELLKAHSKVSYDSLKRDVATGVTNVGAHRDDWSIFNGQDVKRFGSRGQKRIAIGELIFSSQELLAKELGFYPILLLDDLPSELDSNNIKMILNSQRLAQQQTFITTIELDSIPKSVIKNAQVIDLNEIS